MQVDIPSGPDKLIEVGSTIDDVFAIMGTPTRLTKYSDNTYYASYATSNITLVNGIVTTWNNRGNNLKVKQ